VITSPHNPKLKDLRRLARRREERFVAEGEDLLAAADAVGWPALERFVAAGSGLQGTEVEPELLARASALGSGTRAIGVFEQRWAAPTGPLCVALWGVADPGNVGTVVRGALAFGADSVALGPGCADPFGSKAVRASMGAIFAVPLARVDRAGALPGERIALVAHAGEPLAALVGAARRGGAADVGGAREPGSVHAPRELTLVVGAERDGLPADVVAACDRVAHIPIAGDSLNAAMAATIALYEASR
jgi:TrmH family RNA methyltransferase